MDRHAVLVFHNQPLTNEQHLAFTKALGPLENTMGNTLRTRRGFPSAADVRRRVEPRRQQQAVSGRTTAGGSSPSAIACGTPTRRSRRSRRNTRCCARCASPRRAAIPSSPTWARPTRRWTTKRRPLIEDLVCEHSQLFSRESIGFREFTPEERERFRPVRQRLVRTLPRTGRKSIYLSSHAGTIVGWALPEARLLLRDLTEHATQREFVYSHKWQVNDLVIWDNRQTMHRGRPLPGRAKRATCAGPRSRATRRRWSRRSPRRVSGTLRT